ncbi:MAG TPA: ester cyclase [Anaerolineae bacterium]|nr:ester cyclase [Anaerolineae bacterium]
MTDENLQRVNELVEAWNSHDLARVTAFYCEDCYVLDVALAQPLIGREAVRLMFEGYYQAFPDLELTPSDVIGDDDRVALFWTATGTHRGSIMNIPASGRPISAQGVNRLVLRSGLVCTTNTIWDVAGMLRGIGLLPDLT